MAALALGRGEAGSVGAFGHKKASRGFEPRSSANRYTTRPLSGEAGGQDADNTQAQLKARAGSAGKSHQNANVRPDGADFREELLAEGCGRRGSQGEDKAAHRNTARRGQSGASECTRLLLPTKRGGVLQGDLKRQRLFKHLNK